VKLTLITLSAICAFLLTPIHAWAEQIRLAVTTSFNNSGLSDVLLPEIKRDLAFDVHLLVVGTGQALKLGQSGDVDAILVHSRKAEDVFITDGYGTHRREIMYNDFVIVGPDLLDFSNLETAHEALRKIHNAKAPFVSRGDDSGTHRRERTLWQSAGLKPETFSPKWYREVGAGMGATLNTASGMNAFTLTDRGSWLNFANKGELDIRFSGDAALFNQYTLIPVNPQNHPHVKYDLALKLEEWLTSGKAQTMIADYRIGGETLFKPNAK